MERTSHLKYTPRRLALLCLCLVLVLSLALPAFAHTVPDLTKKGSITLTMRYQGRTVSGGRMTLYRVGDIVQDDGDFIFQLTEAFAPSGVSLADPTDPAVALALQAYARDQKLPGTTRIINDQGQAVYPDLEPGLYLLSQQTPSKGFEPAEPFLVSVPMNENGTYVYDVSALPKIALVPEPTAPPPSVHYTLAKTGQSVIPIYVLASIGVVLVLAGWLMTQRRPDDDPDPADTQTPSPETTEAAEAPVEAKEAPEVPAPEAPADRAETSEAPDTPDPDQPTNQA